MVLTLSWITTAFHLYIIYIETVLSEFEPQDYLVSHMSEYNIFEYTNLSCTHAESPVWDGETHTLYWVDVLNQNVHALEYSTWKHKVKHIDYGEVNIVVPIVNSSRLLVGVRSEVFLLDWNKSKDSALRLVAVLDVGMPDNILNEGKADARGRFWAGTKGPQCQGTVVRDEAALYSLEPPDFSPRLRLRPVTISNGLVWALNNTVLYYIDSEMRKIEAFDYDLSRGHISKRRTILDIKEYGYKTVIPDGMTIDKNGFLWVALMFGGTVIRIDPDKRYIVEKIQLPVSQVTSMTWAGVDLDELVVTTSRRDMDAATLKREPLSGAIFILHRLGTSGVPDYKFVFPNADQY